MVLFKVINYDTADTTYDGIINHWPHFLLMTDNKSKHERLLPIKYLTIVYETVQHEGWCVITDPCPKKH